MKKRRMVMGIFLAALVAGLAWEILREREPVYEGKPVSYWINYPGDPSKDHRLDHVPGELPNADSNAVPYLIKALQRRDGPIKTWYIHQWGKSPRRIRKLLPSPIRATQVREGAVYVLGGMHKISAAAIPALILVLKEDDSPSVRLEAISALGNFGPAAHDAIPVLVGLLKDPLVDIREEAERSLQRIDPEAAAKALGERKRKANQ